ncbi:hypothetical protein EMIT0P43_140116 [Pseudomonas jessenii]
MEIAPTHCAGAIKKQDLLRWKQTTQCPHRIQKETMSSFFDELMESVQQMNEILRGERRSSLQTENAEPRAINSAGPSSQVRRPIRSVKDQTDLPQ